MIPLAIIRPEPGWSRSGEAARGLGLTVIGEPLFEVVSVAWQPPLRADVDAVLLGSANAIHHAGPALAGFAGMPAYAVGAATAEAARAAGLEVVAVGTGGLQSLAQRIAGEHRRLLRLCGEDRMPFAAPPGAEVLDRIVYAAAPRRMTPGFAASLAHRSVVALHSARAAAHFAGECDRMGVAREPLTVLALSPAIADAAGTGWAARHAPAVPTDAALLAMARSLCQKTSATE